MVQLQQTKILFRKKLRAGQSQGMCAESFVLQFSIQKYKD
jgi:hypothetical protein